MSKGPKALVGGLALVTLVLVVVFGLIIFASGIAPATENGHRDGFFRQLYLTMLHAFDPGVVSGDSGRWIFVALMMLVTLGGIFVFSALIGIIATGLDAKL